MVPGCTRTELTCWTEDKFTVTSSSGIRDRDVRVAEIVARELEKAKPVEWGWVQAPELWSPQEENFIQVPASEPPHPVLPYPLYLDTLLLQDSFVKL